MDWPGAGPFTFQILHTPYYTHRNDVKGCVELIKANTGAKDTWVKDFPDEVSAHLWVKAGNR